MFTHRLNQVTEQTSRECRGSKHVTDYLSCAISVWCNYLTIPQDEANYILRGYRQQEIQKLTGYLYQEGITEQRDSIIPTPLGERSTGFKVRNPFYQYTNALFNRMNITIGNVKLIVLIAFGVTAVGHFVYRLNQPRQQQTTNKEEPRYGNSSFPSFIVQTFPIQTIAKQLLVLVISASQADFIESLKAQERINISDGEKLYETTKYLWLGPETKSSQSQQGDDTSQYEVLKGEESEYDIHLIYIELSQAEEGFKPNANQLDRYDAFRKLDSLAVTISPRLRMEAYENLEVYSR